jgi:hypothetical protein
MGASGLKIIAISGFLDRGVLLFRRHKNGLPCDERAFKSVKPLYL